MQNNKYTKLISLSLGVMIFSFIIGTALFAWREPAQVPPAGNVPAPINVGIIEQHKAGEIGAHRFEDSQNTSWFIDPNQPISAAFSGNVGIGTGAPTNVLTVQSISTSQTGIDIRNMSAGGIPYRIQSVGSGVAGRVGNFEIWRADASSANMLTIQPGGNVGIGTTAPWGRLHIRVATGSAGIVLESTGVGPGHHGEIAFQDPGTAGFVIMQDSHNADVFSIARGTNPWTRFLSIDNTGNVGIGTATPQSTLQVAGYIQFATRTGMPPAVDCDEVRERGRTIVDPAGALFVCMNVGWANMKAPEVRILSVNIVGSGTVRSVNTGGIFCPGSCIANYAHGTSVILSATSSAGWSFTGWSGACAGTTSTCTVMMTENQNVTATFLGPRRIFITSGSHAGNLLNGLLGADGICQTRANARNLGGTWRAILSSSTVNARDRVGNQGREVRRLDDVLVDTDAGLWDGTLLAPINRNESNELVNSAGAWTGSFFNGFSSGSTCTNWSQPIPNMPLPVGTMGVNTGVGGHWMAYGDMTCNQSLRLYCIEM